LQVREEHTFLPFLEHTAPNGENPVAKKNESNGSLVNTTLGRTGKVSKNYVVFGTIEKVNGRMPILIGNDGTLYLEATLAAKVPDNASVTVAVIAEAK